jgi:23S rRNA (guanine1835-N2)-methyltransferase
MSTITKPLATSLTTRLTTPFGSIEVKRLPVRKNETLRAWDAADELLLNHMAQTDHSLIHNEPAQKALSCLIINDGFGALACSLAHLRPKSWSDSYLSHQALQNNAKLNQLAFESAQLSSIQPLSGQYDHVFIKVPKTLALLEHQLIQLKPHLHRDSVVIAAGMTRHIHNSHIKLFEKYIGLTTTSRAVKKARLIFAKPDQDLPTAISPYPTEYYDNTIGFTICNHANVFSREKLDIGSRFMIAQFANLPVPTTNRWNVVDLGCGNGLLGIMAKKHYQNLNPDQPCQINFVDESYMAIASAKENIKRAFTDSNQCAYFISDCLEQAQVSQVDLIVCNPPFHQSHTIGRHIAMRMFQHSKKVLRRGAQLWVIANRHLDYQSALKRTFGNYHTVADNRKFVVLSATLR